MAKITFPIGRMVWGSVYEAQTKSFDGTPLTIKTGPDAGKPTQKFAFGVAIPKGPERHWSETEWGRVIAAEAQASFPRGEWQQASFAWKITDGDSTAVKKGATRPINQQTGYAGHWVIAFSSTYAPKLWTDNGKTQLHEPNAIKCGYYIQVAGSVAGNNNLANPGVYINHELVNLSGFGQEISTGSDPLAAGFGGALPAGASATPIGGSFAPAGFGLPPAMPGAMGGLPTPTPTPASKVLVAAPGSPYTIEQLRTQYRLTDEQIVAQGFGVMQDAPAAVPTPTMPAFVAQVPMGGLPNPTPVAQATPAMPAMPNTPNAPVLPMNPSPSPVASGATTLVQVPGAQWTIDQCRAAGMTDDQIVAQGVATRGVAPVAGVAPVPSFLGQ